MQALCGNETVEQIRDLRAMDMAERSAVWKHMRPEESSLMPSYEIHELDARNTFQLVAALSGAPGSMTKEDLAVATCGDNESFVVMDGANGNDGLLTLDWWLVCLKATHDKKGPCDGGEWMLNFLLRIRSNLRLVRLKAEWKARAESQKAEQLIAMDMAERNTAWEHLSVEERKLLPTFDINAPDAKRIFVLIAGQSGGKDTIAKDDLIKAHDGDFKVLSPASLRLSPFFSLLRRSFILPFV